MANTEEFMTPVRTGAGGSAVPQMEIEDLPIERSMPVKPPVRESVLTPEDDLAIEIVDDTPEVDRGRTKIANPEPSQEEIESYSDEVKKRMSQLQHGYHDERRAKEAAQREREEAVRVAKQLLEEKKALQARYSAGEEAFVGQIKEKQTLSVAAAKKKFAEAYERADGEAMADAQAEIASATAKLEEANRWRPMPLPPETSLQAPAEVLQPTQAAPQVDPAAQRWATQNRWFGTDEEMTSLAYGVHDKLLKAGVNPAADPVAYYTGLDKRMREVFPNYEWGDTPPPTTSRKAPASIVVASVNRTPGAKRKVTLSASQISLARRLGLTPELYAKEMIKLENSNG